MAFIQIMQFQTTRIDDIRTAVEEWERSTEGKRTVQRSIMCEDRDKPSTYSVIVFFASAEEAERNSALPETGALAAKVGSLCDGPLAFVNLDVVDDRT